MLIEPSLNDPYKALCVIDRATRCKWQVIRSFIMKWGCQSCALAAASSSALGRNRRKTTHTSTLIWAMLGRSSAPIVQRYSVSIRAWVHTKLIRQIVLTARSIELKGSSAASLVTRCPAANQLQVPSSRNLVLWLMPARATSMLPNGRSPYGPVLRHPLSRQRRRNRTTSR